MKQLVYVITFLTLVNLVQAQNSEQKPSLWLGLYGGINLNQHVADFQGLPGIPSCCPHYENGSGTGFTIGGLIDIPLFQNASLSLRPNFSSYNAELLSNEFNPVRLSNETIGNAQFEHQLTTKISSISVDGLLQYKLLNRLGVMAGVRLGVLGSGTFTQQERITSNNGTFKNGKTTQNVYNGDIPDLSGINAGLSLGLYYDLPLNQKQTFKIVPEAMFSYGVTPIVSGLSWSNHFIRFGFSLKYSPFNVVDEIPVEEKQPEKIAPPPIVEKIPEVPTSIIATVVDKNDKPTTDQQIIIKELLSKQVVPVLPMIFFDKNSSQIPKRYRQLSKEEVKNFSEKSLPQGGSMVAYYNLLNVVGSRMKKNSGFTLRLVGTNSDIGEEKGNVQLSQSRVSSIKKYLSEMWMIDPNRIKTETRNLPAKFSNIESEEGRQENSRLELYSDNQELLAPINVYDTARVIVNDKINIELKGGIPASVNQWGYTANGISGSKYTILENEGTPVERKFSWDIDNKDVLKFLRNQNSITVRGYVKSESGDDIEVDTKPIPVNYSVLELGKDSTAKVKTFNVIMFDVDKYELNDDNKKYLAAIIPELKPYSKVTITGYTDRTGDDSYNQTLSLNRARAVARELSVTNVTVQGVGESRPLFDNNLPEGRFYNRTVEVIIED